MEEMISIILIITLFTLITYQICSGVRMHLFKKKLIPGTTIIHHYKQDDFAPMKHVKYLIINRSKNQIKIKDENGWTSVKTISFMSPDDYSFPTIRNDEIF